MRYIKFIDNFYYYLVIENITLKIVGINTFILILKLLS